MIVYDLKCVCGHGFEAWFNDSAGFESQRERDEIDCPLCGSTEISKAVMAPNILVRRSDRSRPARENAAREIGKTLAKLRDHVESNCDYVGDKFAEEARKIHYGEAESRNIYGEATREQSDELRDEGIDFSELPLPPRYDS